MLPLLALPLAAPLVLLAPPSPAAAGRATLQGQGRDIKAGPSAFAE
jgi:hypothetical protein